VLSPAILDTNIPTITLVIRTVPPCVISVIGRLVEIVLRDVTPLMLETFHSEGVIG
jgi:hypothetical protein